MGELTFTKEKYAFYLERIFKKVPLPYNLTAILLILIFDDISAVFFLYTGERPWPSVWLDPAGMMTMMGIGTITAILCIIMLRYLRNRVVDVIIEFQSRLTNPKEVDNITMKVFCSPYQLLMMALFGLGGFLYYIYLLKFSIWPHSFIFWVQCTIWTAFIFHPLIGTLFFFCMGTTFIIRSIGKNVVVTNHDLFFPDKITGLKKLSNLSLFNVFSWVIVQGVNWTSLVGWTLDPILLMAFIIYGILALLLFFVPLFSVHEKIKRVKEKKMLEIGNNIIGVQNKLAKSEEEKHFGRANFLFSVQKVLLNRTDEIKDWPIDLGILIKVTGSAFVPLLGYLIKVLLGLLGLYSP